MLVAAIHERTGAPVIVPTLPTPPTMLFGSFDRQSQAALASRVAALNVGIVELAGQSGVLLLDLATLADTVGREQWFDDRYHYLYKLPVAAAAVPLYADWLARLIAAVRGRSRKCLVLDLDNTCWGGVIGDDGIEGIRVGPGSAEGEAFAAVQRYALDLKARGIILAVSSKNEDATARRAFREHPGMLLRETDIAVFQANWQDKPSNIEAIARSLNIGLDAIVLLDDNAAERAQVRAALPMVAVPELPSDAALYPAILSAAGYFEALSFSDEDRGRAATYAADALRAEVLGKSRDLGDYLQSLDMQISFAPFDALNRARIAQLINKSNQFNLTTRRYTEAEVEAFERDPAVFTLQVRLRDRFSDFGMIGVIIARSAPAARPAWEIDSWLMSCRVLGRRVEQAMLGKLVEAAREAGVDELRGQYIPTEKNKMVAQHFPALGFAEIADDGCEGHMFALSVADFQPQILPFDR
jgi:FkbH-like protein